MTTRLKFHRRVAGLAVLALLPASWFGAQFGGSVSAWAEAIRPSAGAKPVVREQADVALNFSGLDGLLAVLS